jgi:para-aminobenzoate synthetase component 1
MIIKDNFFENFKMKMLNWANQFNIFCLLDNNHYSFEDASFECMLGVGCARAYTFDGDNDLEAFQKFHDQNPSWLFGHLGYNAAGNSYIKHKQLDLNFGDGFFFEPETIIKLSLNKIEVLKSNKNAEVLIAEIENTVIFSFEESIDLQIKSVKNKAEYIATISKLKEHIKRGDCYEVNFCQYFTVENASINPINVYRKLTELSPAPFGSLYKLNDNYCLCASPERFLQKKGAQLISQPIKGTSIRDVDPLKDAANKNYLITSTKEKSENVMVVDLVRNDMSMVCKKGSVSVKELFAVHSFPQVHQLISTIKGTLEEGKKFTDAIQACFPMGSMTGAPKKRVMELIEEYEFSPRGLFSGSIGYITPAGDFDFNVVIRSVFYNENNKKISFFAGSGITFYSNAEEEYEECMLKANALIKVLTT